MKKIVSMLVVLAMLIAMVPAVFADETATLSFASTDNRVSQDTSSQVWEQNGITFTNEKGSSTSNVANYSNPVRCYKSSNITVEYTGMTSIVFECVSGYVLSISSTSDYTVTTSGATVTVAFNAAQDSFTVEGLAAQTRFNSITVSTAPVSAHVHDSAAYGSDETNHWTICTCGDETTAGTAEAHSISDYKCSVCGYIDEPEADSVLTIAEAIALAEAIGANNVTTTNKYYITGTVESIANSTYGNLYITDGTNSLYVYGTYSADGADRFDEMETAPVEGDNVTYYGVVGFYNGAQIKNGWVTINTEDDTTDLPSGTISAGTWTPGSWTAPESGNVTFTVSGDVTVDMLSTNYDLIATLGTHTMDVEAGTTYIYYADYAATSNIDVAWAYNSVAESGDDEGDDDTTDDTTIANGGALDLGENNVTLNASTMPAGAASWTYTATEGGYLTVTVTSVNGEAVSGMLAYNYTVYIGEEYGYGEATAYVGAGETVTVAVTSYQAGPAVLDLSFEAGEAPVVKDPADYFEVDANGNYIIESLSEPVEIFVGDDDIYYQYTAEAAGTVSIVAADDLEGWAATNFWVYVNGDNNYSTEEVEVAKDDVILFNIWGGYEGTVSLTVSEDEGGDDDTGDDDTTTGYTAYLGYSDESWWPGTSGEVTTTVNGADTYTLTWNIGDFEYWGNIPEGTMVCYINIADAWEAYKDYTITVDSVKVDGSDIAVNNDGVVVFEETDDEGKSYLQILLYNAYDSSAYAIEPIASISEKLEITFTLAEPSEDEGGEEESTTQTVYLDPTKDWGEWRSYYAAYVWDDNGSAWYTMTAVDGTSYYTAEIPSNYSNIIFAGFDATPDGWNNCVNQTIDLTIPDDGSNLFTITNGWDEANGWKALGEWSTYSASDDEGGESIANGGALSLGDNNVTLIASSMPAGAASWTYTATEGGNLTVTVASVNGEAVSGIFAYNYTVYIGDSYDYGTCTAYVAAGETVTVTVTGYQAGSAVLNLAMVAAEAPVEKDPDDYFETDANGNYIIDSLAEPVDIFVGNDDIYYVYTAGAAGTVSITPTVDGYSATNCWFIVNGNCTYSSEPVEVAAGDIVQINIWGGYEGTVSLEVAQTTSYLSWLNLFTVALGTADSSCYNENYTGFQYITGAGEYTYNIPRAVADATYMNIYVNDPAAYAALQGLEATITLNIDNKIYTIDSANISAIDYGDYMVYFWVNPATETVAVAESITAVLTLTDPSQSGGDEGDTTVDISSTSYHSFEYTPEVNGTLTVTISGDPGYKIACYKPDDSTVGLPVSTGMDKTLEYALDAGVTYTVKIWGFDPAEWDVVDSTVTYSCTFTPDESERVEEEKDYEIIDTVINDEGTWVIDMADNAKMTVVKVQMGLDAEAGIYTISVNGQTAQIGWAGGSSAYIYAQDLITWGDSYEWTASSADHYEDIEFQDEDFSWITETVFVEGTSMMLGIVSEDETVNVTVEKTGEYVDTTVELQTYENKADVSDFTLPENWTVGNYVDVYGETVHTAVLGEDGYYHLDSEDGDILMIDLDYMVKLYDALSGGRGIMYAVVTDENGNIIEKWDIGAAIMDYVDAADGNGYYPLTEDLIFFYQVYGDNCGFYDPALTTLFVETVTTGEEGNTETTTEVIPFNEECAWMFACLTVEVESDDDDNNDDSNIDDGNDNTDDDNKNDDGEDNTDDNKNDDGDDKTDDNKNDTNKDDDKNDSSDDENPKTGNTIAGVIAAAIVSTMSVVALPIIKKRF